MWYNFFIIHLSWFSYHLLINNAFFHCDIVIFQCQIFFYVTKICDFLFHGSFKWQNGRISSVHVLIRKCLMTEVIYYHVMGEIKYPICECLWHHCFTALFNEKMVGYYPCMYFKIKVYHITLWEKQNTQFVYT